MDFMDDNYCSDKCGEFMTCQSTNASLADGNKPSFTIHYNKCYCTNGEPRKRCPILDSTVDGKKEHCHPELCHKNYKYDKLTGECQEFAQSELDLEFMTTFILNDLENCHGGKSEQITSDIWCGRIFEYPFSLCSNKNTQSKLRLEEYYLNCIKRLCPLRGQFFDDFLYPRL